MKKLLYLLTAALFFTSACNVVKNIRGNHTDFYLFRSTEYDGKDSSVCEVNFRIVTENNMAPVLYFDSVFLQKKGFNKKEFYNIPAACRNVFKGSPGALGSIRLGTYSSVSSV